MELNKLETIQELDEIISIVSKLNGSDNAMNRLLSLKAKFLGYGQTWQH